MYKSYIIHTKVYTLHHVNQNSLMCFRKVFNFFKDMFIACVSKWNEKHALNDTLWNLMLYYNNLFIFYIILLCS